LVPVATTCLRDDTSLTTASIFDIEDDIVLASSMVKDCAPPLEAFGPPPKERSAPGIIITKLAPID